MKSFNSLAIADPNDLIYGRTPHPVTLRNGMCIGGGTVYPELNFTLPDLEVSEKTLPTVLRHYEQIVKESLERAVELEAPGVVLEFETLPPMTEFPDLGMAVVEVLLNGMRDAEARTGLKSALRCTPNDNREFIRPPQMRSGRYWEAMLELFERAAAAGSDFLSIESVGGKELHDDALVNGDLRMVLFALCSVGVRDMRFLWNHIVGIAEKHGVIAAGDTACGFGNTAMVLAERKMIPRTFAAVVRAITAVRSLVAYECGARGPGKDCGYENPILKAITGYPMSMEGKTAACAHLSPMGNLAAATADLWSNESVQNIKLLGGMAPTCYMEQLIYDCRLMNIASQDGRSSALQLRDWLVRSDAGLDPQAYVISPESSVRIARAIVEAPDPYHAGIAAARAAIDLLEEGRNTGCLKLADRDAIWLSRMADVLDDLPDTEEAFIEEMLEETNPAIFRPSEYGLG